jgi:hypothetical protein
MVLVLFGIAAYLALMRSTCERPSTPDEQTAALKRPRLGRPGGVPI